MNRPPGTKIGLGPRVLCVVGTVVALWLVSRRVDVPALGHVLAHLRIGWFGCGIGLFGVGCALAAARWQLVLRLKRCTVHASATLRTAFIGHFFNTLLFGPSGGDIAKSALYARWYRHPMSDILASSFLDRLLGSGGLALFGVLAFGLGASHDAFGAFGGARLAISPRWLIAGGVGLVIFVAGGMIYRRRRPDSFLWRTMVSFFGGARQLLGAPGVVARGLLIGFLSQAAMSGVLAVCLAAVSRAPLPWTTLIWTFPVITVISSIPITVSGTGLREAAALLLLPQYGVPKEDAVAAMLLTLACHTTWALLGGRLWWAEERRLERQSPPGAAQTISIVIPTLNEAEALPETLRHARQIAEVCEIIVVDGGSTDATRAVAEQLGCRVLTAPAGRGGQLRAGAAEARGDVVLLLHADTWLPASAGRALLDCLRDPLVVGGGFWKIFRAPSPLMLGSRPRCALRLLLGGRVLGDQAMFIRREVLGAVGGVPAVPLMEEYELCRLLRARGRLALAGATVATSTRRFTKRGVLRTYARMGRVTLQYHLGTPPDELRRLYERE